MRLFLKLFRSAQTENSGSINEKDVEVEYDDVYKKSINNIIVSSCPKSIEKLEELLDKNGYYGRYKVVRHYAKNIKELAIKIEVYLPDSVHTYTWPLDTHYNLTKCDFGKRKKPRVIVKDNALIKCMYFFLIDRYNISNNLEVVAQIGHLKMGWATKERYIQMIKFLAKTNLFKDGWFVLKSYNDVKEVYENLYDYNYFI